MIGLALSCVRLGDTKRREELLKLQVEITNYQEAVVARERRMQNRMLLLPVEIYSEIFEFILEEDNAQIITLLHICTHWRQVVWGSPGLWRTLVLSKSHADKKLNYGSRDRKVESESSVSSLTMIRSTFLVDPVF